MFYTAYSLIVVLKKVTVNQLTLAHYIEVWTTYDLVLSRISN